MPGALLVDLDDTLVLEEAAFEATHPYCKAIGISSWALRAACGLEARFEAVVVSGDLGVGKPDASGFRHALALVGADNGVMVGDSRERDIDGALAAGSTPCGSTGSATACPRSPAWPSYRPPVSGLR